MSRLDAPPPRKRHEIFAKVYLTDRRGEIRLPQSVDKPGLEASPESMPPLCKGRWADYNLKCNTAKKEERQHANYSVECSYHTTSNTR